MCARYGPLAEYLLFEKAYKIADLSGFEFSDKIVYPHNLAPVVIKKQDKNVIEMMSYSLVPSWSKDRKPKFVTYNARIEDITQKPTWREPFKKRHCLVPMSYFFESCYMGTYNGNIIKISDKNSQTLTAAGLWDEWVDRETGEVIHSFAIITKEPPKDILAAGHDRCPLFLENEIMDNWLDTSDSKTNWVQFLMESNKEISFQFEIERKLKGQA